MKKKTFDCIEMKNAIQQQLLKKYEGMSREEEDAARRQALLESPVMGPLLRKAKLHPLSVEPKPESQTSE